jgi:hypothetical protein
MIVSGEKQQKTGIWQVSLFVMFEVLWVRTAKRRRKLRSCKEWVDFVGRMDESGFA